MAERPDHRVARLACAAAPAGCAAICYGLLAFVLCPPEAFWTGDAGLKLMQVEGLLSSGGRSLALPYLGQRDDPEGVYFPVEAPFAVARGEHWYSTFPPFFAIVTAPFYWLLGLRGLYVIPVTSGVVTVLLSHRLAANVGLGRGGQWFAAVLVALASPVAFYSATFWEHTSATALALGGLVQLTGLQSTLRDTAQRRWRTFTRPMGAGACVGLAFALRYESVLYLIVLATVVAVTPRWSMRKRSVLAGLAAGAAGPMVLVFGLNWVWFGHPMGLLGAHFEPGSGGDDFSRAVIIARMLWSDRGPGFESALLPLFPVCLGAVLGFLPRRQGDGVVASSPLKEGDRQLATAPNVEESAICSEPVPLFQQVAGRQAASTRFVAAVSLGFVGLMLITAPNPGGMQWAARYLLPAVPGLIVATVAGAAQAARFRTGLMAVIAVLGAFSAVRAAEGGYRLWDLKNRLEGPMVQFVEREAKANDIQAVLVAHPYFAQQAAVHFARIRMYRLTGTGADGDLVARLKARGLRRVLCVTQIPQRVAPVRAGLGRDQITGPLPPRLENRHYYFEVWRINDE